MKKYNYNFTVITSGGCNAKCNFCTDPMNYKKSDNYLKNLMNILLQDNMPVEFDQVSISGGEPTISPDLPFILTLLGSHPRFKKKVLTTNGTKLLDHIALIGENVDHVNVSRHGIGYEKNVGVFKNKQIISDENLAIACEKLSLYGVDVNLNWVYSDEDNLTINDVKDYVAYAKSVGAAKVTFRHDQNNNTLDETELEKQFSAYKVMEDGGCPVCRSKSILVNGMYVTFKSSFAEPGNEVGELYELIYHPSGKLTTDWAGVNEYKPKISHSLSQLLARGYAETVSSHSYGSGGCGSGGCGK